VAFVLSDRIKETTTTTGTGTYTLGGATTGFETFTANLSNGDTTYYCCTDGTDFEVGLGTFTSSGTTLARTTILSSSNSNNAVSWSSGTRNIFCTLPGVKAVVKDANGDVTITKSSGDTKLFLEADNDNDAEADNAFIVFKIDGGIETSAIWTGNFGGANDNSLNLTNAGQFSRGISFGTSATNGGWETATERMRIAKDGDITIFGTSGNITFDYSADSLIFDNNVKASFGDDSDFQILHNGTQTALNNLVGNVILRNYADDADIDIMSDDGSGGTTTYFKADGSTGEALLYHYGTEKFKTTSQGVQVLDTGAGSTAVLELGTQSTTEGGFIKINGTTANKYSEIFTSNGNLHIDSAGVSHGVYLNWYTSDNGSSTQGTFFGNGNQGQVGRIDGSGNLTITGALSATTKSFDIEHPTKSNMRLKYGSLEGPENGVYVRGRLKGRHVINLPDYWTGLVHEDSITVNLTPIGNHQGLYIVSIENNMVFVGGENNDRINCFYTVYGERKDVERFEVEYES